ncbi:MAG: alpha-amylase/4-alpha-glucanotransferase domain-containing protein [Gammaproteobacteria bacterium]
MTPVNLLLGVHAHQPVGNFTAVIAEAHEKSYRPFLTTLARYPGFRFAVHFSGWLLQELERDYPQDIALLREMVARGQVEMVGGGIAEPVLASIPHRDRCTQLQAMNRHLAAGYGRAPTGAWLTERVWEATIVPALHASDLRYVTVDDYHFLCTGVPATALDSYYTTEEEGQRLDLFPIAEGLRYRLPFAPAADAVAYLESLAARGDAAAIYFDDIEKFGIWPETYDWVYTRGWLVEFIERVLASPAILTTTFEDFRRRQPGRGLVYLPTASYSEMNEWTLPAPAAAHYAELLAHARETGRLEADRPFLRGGIWRNFLSRYAESNWMHKRMLELSARLARHPEHAAREDLRGLLHHAQANDAYWHGLFGGLYLTHLRRALWRHLLQLDAALGDGASPPPDFDCDGRREHWLRNDAQVLVVRDDGWGAAHEWSSLVLAHNFGDTLRRYAEHYHATAQAGAEDGTTAAPAEGIASAHDRVAYRHAIAAVNLAPDVTGRLLFMESLHDGASPPHPVDGYALVAGDDPMRLDFAAEVPSHGVRISKRYEATGHTLRVTIHVTGRVHALSTALHLAMPSCDGFGGRYRLADGSIPGGFGQPLAREALQQIWLEDSELAGRIALETSRPVGFQGEPFHTVSQSEAGFEQIMQAVRLELRWEGSAPLEITLRVEPA